MISIYLVKNRLNSLKVRKKGTKKYSHISEMGYSAKVKVFSHLSLAIAVLATFEVNSVYSASYGKSSPSMKTYDIWGPTPNKVESKQNTKHSTSSNELLLDEFKGKTSLRNGKGRFEILNTLVCSVIASFFSIVKIFIGFVLSFLNKLNSVEFFCESKRRRV